MVPELNEMTDGGLMPRRRVGREASCMTMLSFRVEEPVAAEAQAWAERLGLDRSELLRQALRWHLLRRDRLVLVVFRRCVTVLSAPRMYQACRVLGAATGC